MNRLAKENLLGSLSKIGLSICESWLSGTANINPFCKGLRPTHPWDLVHSDVCETMVVKPCNSAFYFFTFINDFFKIWLCFFVFRVLKH